MKLLLKISIFTLVVAVLCVLSITLFKNHPEVQLAFFIPGIFIFIYSIARDQLFVSAVDRFRAVRGR